jgi:trk system potassium uptake protein TrkA
VRIIVAGGGSVGIAISQDLLEREHVVTLLEQRADVAERIRKELPSLDVYTCDACEVTSLQQVGLRDCDVMIAATGDDEDNLVISWLAKQEFGVPRVIARVNNSRNEWLFDESWGVDVHVSTPSLITSLVDEAVEIGSVVSLMDLAHGRMKLAEVTLAEDSPVIVNSLTLDELRLPDAVRVVAVLRAHQPLSPQPTMRFLEEDHVIVIARVDALDALVGTFVKP